MLNIDTEKTKQCGNDIIKLSRDLNFLLENLYSRIYNMPTITCEWVGGASELFVKQANSVEKPVAFEFKKTLYSFGMNLLEAAEEYERIIKEEIQ